jgi:hypothetical protein
MSNQVDMFKYYASQLNLSKPQLEAVTNCFQACFEADETATNAETGTEPNVTKQPEEAAPSENRQQKGSFQDTNMWTDVQMKEHLKTDNPLLQKMMNNKGSRGVAKVSKGDYKAIMNAGSNAANGNYHNNVYNEEARQRNMRWQNFLNKTLGLNLAVDGKWGKETAAAYQQYLDSKKQA